MWHWSCVGTDSHWKESNTKKITAFIIVQYTILRNRTVKAYIYVHIRIYTIFIMQIITVTNLYDFQFCCHILGWNEHKGTTCRWNREHGSSSRLTSPDEPLICSFGLPARVWIWNWSAQSSFLSSNFEWNPTNSPILTKHSKPAYSEKREPCGRRATV